MASAASGVCIYRFIYPICRLGSIMAGVGQVVGFGRSEAASTTWAAKSSANNVDISGKTGIIKKKASNEEAPLKFVGKIDIKKYSRVTQNIRTDEVIITDDRVRHIIERRGQKFYDEYNARFSEILRDPDYIFGDTRENTALVCKSFVENGATVNLVVRLAVESDNPDYKNSIITAIKENDKRFEQRVRNNIPLYKKE